MSTGAADDAPKESAYYSGAREAVFVAVLCAAYVFHGMDRSALLVLLNPIQAEFKLSDAQVGLLSGVFYAVPAALTAMPIGWLADRTNRQRLLGALVALWSAATLCAGFAQNFVTLLITRAVVGATESGAPPTMVSMLSDAISPKRRAFALGLFFAGPYIGVIAGSLIAGFISAHWGWRHALIIAGAPGLILAAIILFFIPDPARKRIDGAAAGFMPLSQVLRIVAENPTCRFLLAAQMLVSIVVVAMHAWIAVFLMRFHHFAQDTVGVMTALIVGVSPGVSSIIAGALVSRYSKGRQSWTLKFCALTMSASAPFAVFGLLAGSPVAAVAALCLWALTASAYLGPGFSVLTTILPSGARGTVTGLVFSVTLLVGAAGGPQLVGIASEQMATHEIEGGLRIALAAVCAMAVLPGLLFYQAGRAQAAQE